MMLAARRMERIDDRLEVGHPYMAFVRGDTVTVFVAALASFHRKIPIDQGGHRQTRLKVDEIASDTGLRLDHLGQFCSGASEGFWPRSTAAGRETMAQLRREGTGMLGFHGDSSCSRRAGTK